MSATWVPFNAVFKALSVACVCVFVRHLHFHTSFSRLSWVCLWSAMSLVILQIFETTSSHDFYRFMLCFIQIALISCPFMLHLNELSNYSDNCSTKIACKGSSFEFELHFVCIALHFSSFWGFLLMQWATKVYHECKWYVHLNSNSPVQGYNAKVDACMCAMFACLHRCVCVCMCI